MKLIILFGPLAVGKMTVGQELEKITGLKLFHNHMTIEMVLPFFDKYSKSFRKLVDSFRIQMFEEISKSDLEGLIFTYVWELDQKEDCDFIDRIVEIFSKEGADVYYAELEADAKTRLQRNKSPNRLKHKPSKSDFKDSEEELIDTDRTQTLNTKEKEFGRKNHFKINNTNLNEIDTARMIKEKFGL